MKAALSKCSAYNLIKFQRLSHSVSWNVPSLRKTLPEMFTICVVVQIIAVQWKLVGVFLPQSAAAVRTGGTLAGGTGFIHVFKHTTTS